MLILNLMPFQTSRNRRTNKTLGKLLNDLEIVFLPKLRACRKSPVSVLLLCCRGRVVFVFTHLDVLRLCSFYKWNHGRCK